MFTYIYERINTSSAIDNTYVTCVHIYVCINIHIYVCINIYLYI